jgi:hypothetical protein
MKHLRRPRNWYRLAALVILLGLFVVPGTPGAIMLAASLALLFIGSTLTLRAMPPDERPAILQLFGGGGM